MSVLRTDLDSFFVSYHSGKPMESSHVLNRLPFLNDVLTEAASSMKGDPWSWNIVICLSDTISTYWCNFLRATSPRVYAPSRSPLPWIWAVSMMFVTDKKYVGIISHGLTLSAVRHQSWVLRSGDLLAANPCHVCMSWNLHIPVWGWHHEL